MIPVSDFSALSGLEQPRAIFAEESLVVFEGWPTHAVTTTCLVVTR
jgi:hypothetical protein